MAAFTNGILGCYRRSGASRLAPWLIAAMAQVVVADAAAETPTASPPPLTAADLPRVPPTEPAEALGTFEVKEGFRLELIAHEPQVIDPVDIAYDADGALFAVEMRGYSERRDEALGRVRRLVDRDGDGFYESATVYAERLRWPTSVVCYDGGVFVAASPEILYFKDADGDGVAEVREAVFTGFGTGVERLNVQALVNGLEWGPDNRIWGATAGNGGMVRRPGEPESDAIDLRGRDFSFDPRTRDLRAESGTAQFGQGFSSTGQRFVCSNSRHLVAVVYERSGLAASPFIVLPDPLVDIPADGPAAEVFRLSPDEPWRVVRTRWRVAGLVSGPIEGGGRPSGYFTGASGLTVYTGDALGDGFVDNVFVGDAGSNLVHRKLVATPPGAVQPVARRPADESGREFVASRDNWFRPVNFSNGPDGCLTVVDMYREVIEHPWSLPPDIKRHLDLDSGNDRGRLYRVRREGAPLRPAPTLSAASTIDLCALLAHPNGWHRQAAQRLLWERQDQSAVPLLKAVLRDPDSPRAALHALLLLQGLDALDDSHLATARRSDDPVLRRHAVALSPPDTVVEVADDPAAEVRFAVTLRLAGGEPDEPGRAVALAELARRTNGDPWLEAALAHAVARADEAAALFKSLQPVPDRQLRSRLAELAGRTGDTVAISDVLGSAATNPGNGIDLATAVGRGLAATGRSLADFPDHPTLSSLLDRARALAINPAAADDSRIAAIELCGFAPEPEVTAQLRAALAPGEAARVGVALVNALARHRDPDLADTVLAQWSRLAPPVRFAAIGHLVSRQGWALQLVGAMRGGLVAPAEIPATARRNLKTHADPEVRAQADLALPDHGSDREAIIARFLPALDLPADPTRGREIFEGACAACHRPGPTGNPPLGPASNSFRTTGKATLLTHILDPEREVNPAYLAYALTTRSGDSLAGLVAEHGDQFLTFRLTTGEDRVVARDEVAELRALGTSLMPVGLESAMSIQDMADLLEFLAGGDA